MLVSGKVLSTKNVTKSFFGVKVLDDISFDLHEGEIHAVLGENGAGKTTLMKIISGALKPDHGEICLAGKRVAFNAPVEAQQAGISVIHQELTVFPNLSGAQNVFMGREPCRGFYLDKNRMEKETIEILRTLRPGLDCSCSLDDISPAEQQIIQIARALSVKSKIIIMDEPTAALSSKEVSALFKLMNDLKNRGITIIYITHRLEEVFRISDRITVLRDGNYLGTVNTKEISSETLIKMMTGKELKSLYYKKQFTQGKNILDIKNLGRNNSFQNISLRVHEREIVGITGLVGSQKTELARALFGLERADEGKICFDDEKVNIRSPLDAINLGIGFVPEERQSQILFPAMTVRSNLTLGIINEFIENGLIRHEKTKEASERIIDAFGIRPNDPTREVRTLSGGNQQKVAIARWMATKPRLIMFDEPTRGVDVGARQEIYHLISDYVKGNNGVILISSDLTEIINISDRILVMKEGRIVGSFSAQEVSEKYLREII